MAYTVKSNFVKDPYTPEEKDLINEALREGKVKRYQPACVCSEVTRGTRELVARQRREFRKMQKTEKKDSRTNS